MRADYMMMYSYNRERSLFITHAYGLSTEVWCCPKIKRIKTYKLTLRGFNVDDINDFEKFLRSEEELYEKYPKIHGSFI